MASHIGVVPTPRLMTGQGRSAARQSFFREPHQSVTHNSRAMVSMRNLLGKIYCSGQSQSARLGLTSTLLRPLATRRTPCGPSERQRAFWMSWLIGPVRRIRTLMPAWSLARDAVESLQT